MPLKRWLGDLICRRLGLRRSTQASGRLAHGQALAEFSIVLLFLVPIIILITVLIFALYQNWAVHQAENWLGDRITTTGSAYDPGESGTWVDQFIAEVHHFGLVLNSTGGNDFVTIKVTSAADGSVTPYTLASPAITANYGDLVQITYQSPVSVGPLTGYAEGAVGFLVPDSQSPWSGIAQRNGAAGVINPAQGGGLQGTISGPGGNLSGAQVSITSNVTSGCSSSSTTTTTSLADGSYSFKSLSPCDYDVVVELADYAPSVSTVNVISNLTTTANFFLTPAAAGELVLAGRSGASNLLVNGDFETADTFGWSSGPGVFTTAPHSFAASTAAASWGNYGGLVVTDASSADQGVYQSLAGTFAGGHHYGVFVWFRAAANTNATIELGTSDDHASSTITDILGGWQLLWTIWTPGTDRSGVEMAIRVSELSAAVTMELDEAVLLDGADTYRNSDGLSSDGVHVQMNSGLQPISDSVFGASGPSSGPQVNGVGAFLFLYVVPCDPEPAPCSSPANPTVQITTPSTSNTYRPSRLNQGQALIHIVAVTAPLDYPAIVLDSSGLDGYWRLGEASGTSTADASGNEHTGALIGSVGHGVSGALLTSSNTAFSFDGASGYAVTATNVLSATDNFTLEGWVEVSGTPGDLQLAVYNGTDAAGYGFGVDASGNLIGYYGGVATLSSGISINDGNWHLVELVRSAGTTWLYLDGALAVPGSWSDAPLTPIVGPLSIGREDGTVGRYFSGSVDEVAAYAAALSDSSIAARWVAAGHSP